MADQGPGFALPAISFAYPAIEQPAYRIGVIDQQGYNDGFAAGEAAHADDYANGYAAGEAAHADDFANGYAAGYAVGFDDGVASIPQPSTPTITIVSPTPGVPPGQPGGFPANRDEAIRTPIVLRLVGVDGGLASVLVVVQFFGSQADLDADLNGVEMTVYRRGSFRGKHTKGSTAVMDGDDIVLTIFREGGWQGRFIKFDFDGAGTGGG